MADTHPAMDKYPYLKGKGIEFLDTPDPTNPNYLEFWPPDEEGDEQYPRPKEIPLGKVGIQTFKNVSPEDILGDYVSHYGVSNDPYLKEQYDKFKNSVPDSVMRDRYSYHVQNLGERRPYDQWLNSSGMPEYFRGYTFNQWPNAERMYGPEQLRILNQVRDYLNIK